MRRKNTGYCFCGSHLLRIGGAGSGEGIPKKADHSFREIINKLEKRIEFLNEYFQQNPIADLSNLGLNKPSSTWTYVINDFPFGNALGIMLNQNSNFGFQVDILSLFVLFVYRLFKRGVHRNKSDSKDE
jgi:preprotein translocase subunit SecA